MARNHPVRIPLQILLAILLLAGMATSTLPLPEPESDRPSPELSGDFVRSHAGFEVTPDRALAVIERDEEFSTRATRWAFIP